MPSNLYDDIHFFEGYCKIRDNLHNYNNLVEQPAIKKLLPQLEGKVVLDLGCGYGNNCRDFIERGAKRVVGVDLSSKMLEVAKRENAHPNIEYIQMDMNEIMQLKESFDLVFSSLAFHYVADYRLLISHIKKLLKVGGVLLYSQEHPCTTAPKKGCIWTKDEEGHKLYTHLSDYMYSGIRKVMWLDTQVEKYHRSLSEIINTLIKEDLTIEEMVEPVPDEQALLKRADMIDEFHRPTALIIKARRS